MDINPAITKKMNNFGLLNNSSGFLRTDSHNAANPTIGVKKKAANGKEKTIHIKLSAPPFLNLNPPLKKVQHISRQRRPKTRVLGTRINKI